MKKGWMIVFTVVTVIAISCLISACDGENISEEVAVEEEKVADRPTIPGGVPEGMEYLYDFTFSENYDNRVSDEFSVIIPNEIKFQNNKTTTESNKISLFEEYVSAETPVSKYSYDGDGMVPHSYNRYWYTFGKDGNLLVETDFYEPDKREYISYFWTDIKGAMTDKNVAIGESEDALLGTYTENLDYIDKNNAEPCVAKFDIDLDVEFEFDYAYAWQPYNAENNDIRDITFYIKDGKISSIEVIKPFELRYVY